MVKSGVYSKFTVSQSTDPIFFSIYIFLNYQLNPKGVIRTIGENKLVCLLLAIVDKNLTSLNSHRFSLTPPVFLPVVLACQLSSLAVC